MDQQDGTNEGYEPGANYDDGTGGLIRLLDEHHAKISAAFDHDEAKEEFTERLQEEQAAAYPTIKDWGLRKAEPGLVRIQMPRRNSGRKAEELERAALRLLAQAAELDARPSEPTRAGRASNLVMIEKRFEEGGEIYRWACVRGKSASGVSRLWWLSGKTAPTRAGMPWAEVLDFIYDRAYTVRFWAVTSMTEITREDT